MNQKYTRLNKNNIRVGCNGFYPSVANYNGFKTLGAYENIYPLKFKKLYNIIKDEIKQNKHFTITLQNGEVDFIFLMMK